MNKISFIIILLIFITGCAPKLYEPEQPHVDWVASTYRYNGTVSEFDHARTMYSQYCHSCHDLHMPKELTIAEWNHIFPEMSLKISLADSSKQQIYYYLIAGAKDAGVANK